MTARLQRSAGSVLLSLWSWSSTCSEGGLDIASNSGLEHDRVTDRCDEVVYRLALAVGSAAQLATKLVTCLSQSLATLITHQFCEKSRIHCSL